MTSFIFSLLLFFLGDYIGLFLGNFYAFRHFILLLALCFALSILSKKFRSILAFSLCLAMFTFGLWNGLRFGTSAQEELQDYLGKQVIVSGTVDSLSWKEKDGLQSFVLDVKKLEVNGTTLSYHKKIRVNINEAKILQGKEVLLVGKLRKQVGFRNPGSFDSKTYYRVQGIGARLASARLIHVKDNTSLLTRLALINISIRQTLAENLPTKLSNLLGGMLLGGSGLDDESREIFADNGISHLLSVSGTHLVLLAGLLLTLLKPLPSYLQKIIVLAYLSTYAMFCGLKAPVLRALLMSSIVLYGGGGVERGRLLGLAGLFLLLYKPVWLLDTGFQLSFGASAGLIYLLPKLKARLIFILPELLAEALSVTLSVQIITLPIVIQAFHQISVISLISNIFFLPLLELAALLALVGLNLWYALHVQSILKLSSFFLEQVLLQAELLRNLPFSTIAIASMPAWSYGVYYALLILWMDDEFIKNLHNKERNISIKVLSLGLLVAYIWSNLWIRPFAVYFLDVGQGDCAAIVTPWRKVIVVDTGGLKNYDTGANILAPFLRSIGKKQIDYLMLSHYDNDHVGGLRGLLRNVKVDTIILPRQKVTESSWEIYQLCKENKAKKFVAKDGMEFTIDNTKIEILGAGTFDSKANEASTVAKISYGGKSILFTGDMDASRENDFIANPKADVLKVAHHGSKSSSTLAFISRVEPALSIVSVGRNNMYGHPHKNVLNNLHSINSKILRTDQEGCIKITFDDGKIKWYTYVNDKKLVN
ncbi:MAG: DNA internalization-related competence protein ComEC/Rec2 [Phascolarctobacterium sp.]|nr:DNA internalization-related competence protein ComEC/Rec2 [Phascolarctobacterium sp.]